jgi:hypothetical protein
MEFGASALRLFGSAVYANRRGWRWNVLCPSLVGSLGLQAELDNHSGLTELSLIKWSSSRECRTNTGNIQKYVQQQQQMYACITSRLRGSGSLQNALTKCGNELRCRRASFWRMHAVLIHSDVPILYKYSKFYSTKNDAYYECWVLWSLRKWILCPCNSQGVPGLPDEVLGAWMPTCAPCINNMNIYIYVHMRFFIHVSMQVPNAESASSESKQSWWISGAFAGLIVALILD